MKHQWQDVLDEVERRKSVLVDAPKGLLDIVAYAAELRASNSRLREALEVAKEAMDERRSYVNNGDPSTCWQEMKYGAAWDAEDELVRAALVVKP